MGINKQIEELFDALNKSDLPDKEELKSEAGCCINSFIDYFNAVVNEQIYYSSTTAGERNAYMMKLKDGQRRGMHDVCILSCARLNEICRVVNVDEICELDISDRRKVASFCGLLAIDLLLSNIS